MEAVKLLKIEGCGNDRGDREYGQQRGRQLKFQLLEHWDWGANIAPQVGEFALLLPPISCILALQTIEKTRNPRVLQIGVSAIREKRLRESVFTS